MSWFWSLGFVRLLREKKREHDSHVVQDTPAAVRVTRAQTLGTCAVLLAGFHGNLGHLMETNEERSIIRKLNKM